MAVDNEPLRAYQSRLAQEFADNSRALFEGMVAASGVDAASNQATIARLRRIEAALADSNSKNSLWQFLRVLLILASVAVCIVVVATIRVMTNDQGSVKAEPSAAIALGIVGASAVGGFIWLLVRKVNPRIRALKTLVGDQSHAIEATKEEAKLQMAALNGRFDWDMSPRLIEKVMPEVKFDPYFTSARLTDLRKNFGWNDKAFKTDSTTDRSILHAVSGTLYGNPFVIAETREFSWGKKTYTGSKVVSYTTTELYTNSKGKLSTRVVTKHTVLFASLQKPFPEYRTEKRLLFGSASASALSFRRIPSQLDASGSGLLHRWKFWGEVRRLRAEARRDFKRMLVSNLEFEVYFGAHDRSHPQQFRLLFTPLAQDQMVKLIRDRRNGFGGNFEFSKSACISTIRAPHMAGFDFVDHPARYVDIDLEAARRKFLDHSREYFRRFYFSIAPLLAVPLYCERHAAPLRESEEAERESCSWEHEAIANFHGMDQFKHPECVTESLLHAESEGRGSVRVTAKGFRRKSHIEPVLAFAPDGKAHLVPVQWDEYIPVQKATLMQVRETPNLTAEDHAFRLQNDAEWTDVRSAVRTARGPSLFRRRTISWIPR